ncbi:hypothetical protein MDA_GLEAN10020709 [Myotis davidii]|uniref:Uncharacterized protein n=1 Tax=Myotis davidii TaxID=225400 RepID=L5LH15_MYODS|nr:hypothetical protein MDA_GLEAN10020709 [Myotis davidii]
MGHSSLGPTLLGRKSSPARCAERHPSNLLGVVGFAGDAWEGIREEASRLQVGLGRTRLQGVLCKDQAGAGHGV